MFFFGFPLLIMMAPVPCGIIGGIITSVGLALFVVSRQVHSSNHFGYKERIYEDYTDEPMQVEH